jgi:MtN3 and saliva related transmembrane protein
LWIDWPGLTLVILFLAFLMLLGCQDLVPRDKSSLFIPGFRRSEIFDFVAGFGTTFAAVPDLAAMLRRRSSAGMNPRMAAIMGAFQVLCVYYGLLIASPPVIVWNMVAVLINLLSVGARDAGPTQPLCDRVMLTSRIILYIPPSVHTLALVSLSDSNGRKKIDQQ